MSVKVEYSSQHNQEFWAVRFASQRVQFRSEQSAHAYAAKLKERIEAAHQYPCRNELPAGQ